VLSAFTGVYWPRHLASDGEGRTLVADTRNHRILLLSSEMKLERVLVDGNSQAKLRWPSRLSYNQLTSQLYVVHGTSDQFYPLRTDVVSVLNLRLANHSSLLSFKLSRVEFRVTRISTRRNFYDKI